MSNEVDYAVVAADLEARIASLQALLAGVRALMGQGSIDSPPTGSGGGPAPVGVPEKANLLKEVVPGVFHGMSVSEAARTFLEMTKVKQKTRAICDALTRGGIESDARDFYSNVYTTLDRNKDFFKRGKYWMLTSWDPRRAAAAAVKPAKRKKAPRSGGAPRQSKGSRETSTKVVGIASGTKAETA
jgi:hypothetical protein